MNIFDHIGRFAASPLSLSPPWAIPPCSLRALRALRGYPARSPQLAPAVGCFASINSHALLAASDVRADLERHAMACYPDECCALLVLDRGTPRAVLAANLMDEAHARHPRDYDRTSATGFSLDPMEIVRSRARGEHLVAIVHSHVAAPASFSSEDRRRATTASGEPLFPDVQHVVLEATRDGIVDTRVFEWAAEPADFVEVSA